MRGVRANNFAAIYPRQVVDKFKPAEKATEWIGTGPFKMAEWKPDRHIKMIRFDDYQPRNASHRPAEQSP